MNLIMDRWIPVKTHDGEEKIIRPSEMVSLKCFLNFPRPDFNLSGLLFLIGLVHLVKDDLTAKIKEPGLLKMLSPFSKYFDFIGDNPILFMQDASLGAQKKKKSDTSSVFTLFLDSAKDKAVRLGKDFFRKEKTIETLCPSCSAIALYTGQIFAPCGGQGYFPSPLANKLLVLNSRENLWDTVQANLVDIKNYGSCGKFNPSTVFPWTTKCSETRLYKYNRIPGEHLFWITPWRCKVLFEKLNQTCDCCGKKSELISKEIYKYNTGIEYDSTFLGIYKGTSGKNAAGEIVEIVDISKDKKTVKISSDGCSPTTVSAKEVVKAGKLDWDFPFTANYLDETLRAHIISMDIITALKIIYCINPYSTMIPVKEGLVNLCGVDNFRSGGAKYNSWSERIVPFKKSNRDLVIKLLSIEQEIWGAYRFFADDDSEEHHFCLTRSFESILMDLLETIPKDVETLWKDYITNFYIEAFNNYHSNDLQQCRKFRKCLENKFDVTITVPRVKEQKKEKQKLSADAVKLIVKWFYWINHYSKTSKEDLKSATSWEGVIAKPAFSKLQKNLGKVLNSVGEGGLSSEEINKIALAVYLVVQLKSHNKTLIDWSKFQNKYFEKAQQLKSTVKNMQSADIINIFNQILYN